MSTSLPIFPAGPAASSCCAPMSGLDPALDAERIATVAKALAEPLRVRILDVLRRSPGRRSASASCCRCSTSRSSTLSHHVNKLVDAGLVRRRAPSPVGLLLR